jgi:hypothetical protein
MSDDTDRGSAPRRMTIIVTDKGQSHEVTNVDRWIEERKTLLRQGLDLVKDYDGNPRSLYPQHGTLVTIARRLAEIKVIFDTYNRERNRHADANITALVAYFTDPRTLEGIGE